MAQLADEMMLVPHGRKVVIYHQRMIRRNRWRSAYCWGMDGRREWVDLGNRARRAKGGRNMPSASWIGVGMERRYSMNRQGKDRYYSSAISVNLV